MTEKDEKDTPRIVQNFNIGSVGQLNPVATTVVNNYYGDNQRDKAEKTLANKEVIRPQIIEYVSKTLLLVSDEWRNKYMDLWNDILKIDEVDAEVYEKGKQVANIIHILGNWQGKKKGVFKKWEAKEIAVHLESTWECSTRTQLGIAPSTAIQNAILKLFKSPQYKS